MRKQWFPTIVVDIDGDEHVFKTFMAVEMESIAKVTDGQVSDQAALIGNLAVADPRAWRAIKQVALKRQGTAANWDDVDVDLNACELSLVDSEGREVETRTEPKPCRPHSRRGIQDGCPDCGQALGAVEDEYGNFAWFYVGTDEMVPTKRSGQRRSASDPSE